MTEARAESPRSQSSAVLAAPTGGATGGQAWALRLLLLAVVLAPIVTLSQFAAHWRLDVVDDQMFGYFGWRIAHGAAVYRDVWDNKPPAIYWTNALGFLLGGDSYAGVVALCVLALVATHALFLAISASLYFPSAAALTTALAAFYITHTYYQGGTNRTETFLVPFELAGVLLCVRGQVRDRAWKFLLAGACCGVAFLFKQVGLAAWGALGLHTILLVLLGDLDWRAGLRRCLLLVAGLALTVGVASAALAAQGSFDSAVFATFGFNRAYFAVGRSQALGSYLNFHLLKFEMFPILRLPVLMVIAGLAHAILWWLRPWLNPLEIAEPLRRFQPACRRYLVLLAAWTAAAFYGAVLSPHCFRHYLLPVLPPLLLMAGYLINVIAAETTLLTRIQQRAWVAAAFVAMGYFAWDAFDMHLQGAARVWIDRQPTRRDGQWHVTLADWEKVGDEVARRTRPDERIQCWGYMPGVYLRARRENVCRFTTNEKIGQVGAEADFVAQELQETLEREPPSVFVISSTDYAWITGQMPGAKPAGTIGGWLAGWLERNFVPATEIHNIMLFERRGR